MKRKGFTLIELLAVIVVLAVIMVIAVPKILDVIESSRMSAAKSSAEFYIDAIEKNNALSQLDNSKNLLISDGEYDDVTTLNVNVKGEKPTSGSITIEKGRVKEASLCVSGYNVEYNNRTATVTGKCESEEYDEVVYADDAIYTKAKALVYKNGTCKTDDTTYKYMNGCYIKGASTNNYVWYNGFMWRIMGINSDGTVRLITDENVTAIPYGASNTAENYATNEGYINDWLNDYFYNKLNSTKSIIQNGSYFCSETIGATLTDDTVRTKCTSGKEVNASVGLISYDEHYLAGLFSSYLNIGQVFWTMTPYRTSDAWYVANGVYDNYNIGRARGIRPVINVSSTSTITKGDGTALNYYVLSENKDEDKTGTLGENVTSGEYVKLEGKTYRVVSKESDGVKLILDGYYENPSGTIYGDSFGRSSIFKLDEGIGQNLNGYVLTWLGLSNSDKIVTTTWYQGDEIGDGFNYIDVLNSTNNAVSAKVGLIRVGEMLSGQSSTILTKNYTIASSYNNATGYWTINKYEYRNSCIVLNGGVAGGLGSISLTGGYRPVIKVKTDLTISKGNGTWDNPYEI